MTAFFPGVPVRLAVPWMPPVTGDPSQFAGAMADVVDDAGLHEYFILDRYAIAGDSLYFYLRTERRKNELKTSLRHEKKWHLLLKRFPEAMLEFAEDLEDRS